MTTRERHAMLIRLAEVEAVEYLTAAYPRMAERMLTGGVPSYYPWKLMELHWFCEQRKPRTIVELGSGWTTCVFAAYAKAHPGVKVTTVESNREYAEQVKERLSLVDGIEPAWHITDVVIEGDNCRFRSLPDTRADLLYVDGPDNRREGGEPYVCVDADHIHARWVLFDWRFSSVTHYCWNHTGPVHMATRCDTEWLKNGLRHHTIVLN